MENKGEYKVGILLPEMLLQMFSNKWISSYVLGMNFDGTIYAFMEPNIGCEEEQVACVVFNPDELMEIPKLTQILKLAIIDKNPEWKPPVNQYFAECTDEEE